MFQLGYDFSNDVDDVDMWGLHKVLSQGRMYREGAALESSEG